MQSRSVSTQLCTLAEGSQAENCFGQCDEKETFFFTFTFLMQEKHCLSFAFDYTMFIKHAAGSLITPAVWPRPTACVFNQGVWKQSSHSDSARHLHLICGALTYGCKPGSGIHKQPKVSFSVRSLYGTCVGEWAAWETIRAEQRRVIYTRTDRHTWTATLYMSAISSDALVSGWLREAVLRRASVSRRTRWEEPCRHWR